MRRLILGFLFVIATIAIGFSQSEDCATSTGLAAADLTDGVTTVGATTADNTASGYWGLAPMVTISCDNPTTLTIDEWWRLDVTSGNDLEIDLTSATTHMLAIVQATTVNCGTPNSNTLITCFDPSLGTNPMIFENCFEGGMTYYLVVLTDAANQGPYDLTVTEMGGDASAAVGDLCASAIVLDPVVDGTDGMFITCNNTVSGTTLNNLQEAKNDQMDQPGCIELNEASIWYSFTAGDDIYIENTNASSYSAALYSGACGALSLIQCAADGNISEIDNPAIIPGNTYFLQIAFDYGLDGPFDVCINSPLLPTEDDCATPEALGTLTDGVTTSATIVDNFGATSTGESFVPGLIAACGAGSFSTVYHEFTIGGVGNSNVNINYTEGTITTSQITVLEMCTDAAAFMSFEWTGSTDEEICLMPGTYLIQIASCDADEGSYTLDLTSNPPPTNDECANAELLEDALSAPTTVIPPICQPYTVTGTTEFACVEPAAIGACSFDMEGTVWYTFTTNATTPQEAEITLTPITMGLGQFALIEGSCAGSIVGTCQTDGTEAMIALNPSTQYFIAVAPQVGQVDGTFDLEVVLSSIPTNDDCMQGANPDILTTTMGSNHCADGDVVFCGMTLTTDHQVFYEYTNNTGANADLEVTFNTDATNGLGATDISMLVLENDCTTFTVFNGTTNADYCNILGATQTIACIEDGETIIIVVGSPDDGSQGEFTITTNEITTQPVALNDECTDASDITPVNTCEFVTITADNNNACPEDFLVTGGCNFNADPTVWYSVTVPNDGNTYALDIADITDAASYLAIFDAAAIDCDNPGTTAISSDCETGAGPHGMNYDNLVNGNTYLIAFGNPTEGIYSFDVSLNLLPDNDDCDLVNNPDILVTATGTTACANGDYDFCTQTMTDDHHVFYQYTNNTGGNVDLEVTLTGDPVNGNAATDISMVVFEDNCAVFTVFEGTTDGDYCSIIGNMQTIDCIEDGVTVLIMVGSPTGSEGDFTITTNENTTQPVDDNDECDDALLVFDPNVDNTCEWITVNGSTVDACPEDFTQGGCAYDQDPTVWYSFTAPTSTNPLTVELQNLAGVGALYATIYEMGDCDNPIILAGAACDSGVGPFGPYDIVSGTTYLIAVGDPGGEGAHSFDIKINELPPNDECADADVLSSGVATAGTNTCATQEIIPYNSNVCTDADEVNTVWYEFTVPAGVNGFDITVAGSGAIPIMGDINMVVFESMAAGCTADGSTFADEACATVGELIEDFQCIGPGTYVIRISTTDANSGDFDITVTEYISPVANDLCDSPTVINVEPECEWYPVDANTVDACPEQFDFGSDCGFDDFPVVWYEIDVTDDDATEIQINMLSSASGTAFYSVFAGSPASCDDLVPTSVSGNCETGVGMNTVDIDIEANGPMTYLIGVGADVAAGSSSIMFEIKVVVPPANDDPCDAEIITTAGDVNTVVPGTTTCATMDLDDTQCGVQDENSVWYEYTIPPGGTGFSVTLASTGTGDDFALAVFGSTPCNANPTFLDGAILTDCESENGDEQKFPCLDEGTTVWIFVATTDQQAGDFELTIDPIVPDPLCVDNDLCADADDTALISTPVTDGGQLCIDDCNIDACPENYFANACTYNDFPTVFYSVTTDALADDATMSIILSSADGNPLFSVFEACAEPPTAVSAESLCVEGDGFAANLSGLEVDANTTYIIAVALDNIDEEGGDFELCVNVTTSCNDDPCSPYPLVTGDGVGSPALDCDTNIGATDETFDYTSPDCVNPELFQNTVYFSYTAPANIASFTVTVTNDPVTGMVNEAVLTILEYDAANCDQVQIVAGQACGDPAFLDPVEVQCPPEGNTYLIQVSTASADEGDFDIELTENLQTDPCSTNDDCDAATDLDISETCVWLEFFDCNVQACPEEFSDPGDMCAFDESPVVWFSFTTPANATSVSIDIEPDNAHPTPIIDPTWALLIDDGCAELPTAVNGDVICVTTGGGASAIEEDVPIDENTTYYIAVGSETAIEGGFVLNIKVNVPPINDDPCNTMDNPPLDLTGGGSHQGTTCCARGPKVDDVGGPGGVADLESVECSNASEDAAVWYTYTPSDGDDGYDVILENVGGADGAEGPISVEVYWGTPDQGCNGFGETVGESCADLDAYIKIGNCPEPGQILFVKVSTDDADDMCGEFLLSILPANCANGDMFDDCIDAQNAGAPIEPVTNEMFQIDYTCIPGCLDYACPDDANHGGCDLTQSETVWFQVTADDIAAQMFTTVEPNGTWTPIWSVYSGPDCDNLSVVNFGGSPPCSNGDNTPDLHQTSVFDDEDTYWISITADPNGEPVDDGGFELCVATTINAIICLGELEGGLCDDESLVMEITDRELDLDLDPDGDGVAGPFCAGETISINVSFFYDASESGADWLIGFVPIFGNGWDIEEFIPDANAPVGNGQTGQWYEEGGECAPILQEPNPILCTFTNGDGNLELCNLLCAPCSECPQQFMEEGDPLPSGYFWVSNGGNAGCDNDCSPGEGWGIGSVTSQIDWEFTLTVKEFESQEDCFANNDLSISFQTFSDGTGGCWEDPVGECLLDRAMFSPPWKIECNAPPAVTGPDQEICDNGMVDIFVSTVDGTTNDVVVEVVDNPNVTGEMGHTFTGGTGTIDDVLDNTSNTTQIVVYSVYAIDETLPCPGPINEIEVTIYPELEVTFPPLYVCDGFCTDISPNVVGGIGEPYSYVWSTGETTPSIEVCPLVPTTYSVTVTDLLGCEDIEDVEVDVKPPVEAELDDEYFVCKDEEYNPFDPTYVVFLDITNGTAPYQISWSSTPAGLVLGTPIGGGTSVPINEQASSEFNSPYELCAEVVDAFGCTDIFCTTVIVTGEIILDITITQPECGETTGEFSVFGITNDGTPLTSFVLYGNCPQEDFLEELPANGGNATFINLDLLAYSSYTVVGFTDPTEGNCSVSTCVDFILSEGTPIQIDGTADICEGEQATITITNASDYDTFVWTPDVGNTGEVMFNPDSTATYQVVATDATGCVATEIFTVTVNPPPVVGLSGTTTFCEGSSASITASGGVDYLWTPGGTTDPTFTTSTAGDVTVTVTDANGCSNDSLITFTQEDVITINLGDVNICDGMGDTIFVAGDFINFEWSDGTTVLSTDDFFVITGAGTFTVTAQDAASGCDAMGSFEVMDFMTPQVMVSDTVEVCRVDSGIDSLCINFNNQVNGDAGTWTQVGSIPGFTFSDYPLNNVCFDEVSNPGIQTGFYTFVYTTTTAQPPCMNVTDTMVVRVKACPCPSPATSFVPDLCNDDDYDLSNSVLTGDPGTWSVVSGPGGQDINGLITGTIFDATGVIGGPYTVRFTLDNPGNPPACEEFSEQTFDVYEAPQVNVLGEGDLCNIDGGSSPTSMDLYDLIDATAGDGGSWVQDGGETVAITGGSMILVTGVATVPQDLTFTYTTPDDPDSPCPPAMVTVTVEVRDCNCPQIEVSTDTLCNNGLPINLDDLLFNPEGLAGSWSVAPGLTLTGGNMVDPAGVPSGLYEITWTLDASAGPNCPLDYVNNLLIRKQPEAVVQQGPLPCSMDTGNGPTFINLFDWLESGYSLGTWTQTGGSPMLTLDNQDASTTIVDFDGQPVSSVFTFTYTTNAADDPCSDIMVDVVITVQDCNCPPIELIAPEPVCNDGGMIVLGPLAGGSDPGTFTVFTASGADVSSNIVAGVFDATGLNAGTYTLIFTLDQTVTGACVQSLSEPFEIANFFGSGDDATVNVCNDPDGNGVTMVDLTIYVVNAASGTWVDESGAGVDLSTLAAQQNVSFVGVPVGSYDFSYTYDNEDPCPDYTHTITVVVTDDCDCPPINLLNPADVCNTAGPVDLSLYDDPNNAGSWSSTDLTVNGGNMLDVDGASAGMYTLYYTLDMPLDDCPPMDSVEILIGEPAITGTAQSESFCEGSSNLVDLAGQLSGQDPGGTWTETTGSTGFDPVAGTFDTDGQAAGTYSFVYTLSNNEPCPDETIEVNITIDPNPVADAGDPKMLDCEITSATLGGSGTTMGSNITYSWVDIASGDEVGTDPTLVDYNVEGDYELIVTNSATGCMSSDQTSIVISDDLPSVDVEPTDITCNGDDDGGVSVTNPQGGDGDYTYTLGTGNPVTDPSVFGNLPAGEYMLTIMDGNGCMQTYPFSINEPDAVFVDAGPEILVGDVDEEFTITLEYDSTIVTNIVWTDLEDATDTLCQGLSCSSLTVNPTEIVTGYYVAVFDANGCMAFDEVQIQLEQIVDVEFPNIISPNGDNTNDVFYIKSDDVETVLKLKIFDRWGEKIFDIENAPPRDPSVGWDGKFKDKSVVPGVYVFYTEILFIDGTTKEFSGDVTVMPTE